MEKLNKIFKELLPYILIVVIVVTIRTFIITPVRVDGASMDPTLKDGQILLLSKISNNYKRFDIVVINKNGTRIVKRIIGLPGETLEYKKSRLYINGKIVKDKINIEIENFDLKSLYGINTIPEGYYFVMGDNRNNSSDSRDPRIGLVKKSEIEGKTVFRIWPFNNFGTL